MSGFERTGSNRKTVRRIYPSARFTLADHHFRRGDVRFGSGNGAGLYRNRLRYVAKRCGYDSHYFAYCHIPRRRRTVKAIVMWLSTICRSCPSEMDIVYACIVQFLSLNFRQLVGKPIDVRVDELHQNLTLSGRH